MWYIKLNIKIILITIFQQYDSLVHAPEPEPLTHLIVVWQYNGGGGIPYRHPHYQRHRGDDADDGYKVSSYGVRQLLYWSL